MTAIVGRMACGHVVAVDLDDTPSRRGAFRKRGYTVEVSYTDDAIDKLKSDGLEHVISKCDSVAKVSP